MRCFISIELPNEVKEEINKVQNELKINSNIKSKIVEKENLHLTLKFLGEISDKKIEEIKKLLTMVNINSFKAYLGKIGVFPTPTYIRVIWVGLEPKESFEELHDKIDLTLNNKDKRFESHVTLARIKSVKDKASLIKKLQEIKVKPLSFDANSFILKKSTLTKKGPIYEDIAKFALKEN